MLGLMDELKMNYLAVLTAAVAYMILGALWFSPLLFGNPWLASIGKRPEELRKDVANLGYAVSFACALVLAYVLDQFLQLLHIVRVLDGIQVGFWVGIGFMVTATMPDYIFTGRPRKLYAINVGYPVVATILMSAILTLWK